MRLLGLENPPIENLGRFSLPFSIFEKKNESSEHQKITLGGITFAKLRGRARGGFTLSPLIELKWIYRDNLIYFGGRFAPHRSHILCIGSILYDQRS